jgi:hypothetical protein
VPGGLPRPPGVAMPGRAWWAVRAAGAGLWLCPTAAEPRGAVKQAVVIARSRVARLEDTQNAQIMAFRTDSGVFRRKGALNLPCYVRSGTHGGY